MSIMKPNRDDFQEILQRWGCVDNDHNGWLLNWHRALLCSVPADTHQNTEQPHLRCEFGKWYHSDPSPYLAQFPIFRQIGLLHTNMHSIANRLLQHGMSDQPAFLCEYNFFLKARGEFLDLVDVLETEISGMLLHIDAITHITEHRKMLARLHQCQERLEIQQESSVLCLLKLDYPHKIFEGREQPDEEQIVSDIAHFLATHLRAGDIIFRSGVDEFLLVLSNISLPTANTVIERLRIAFENNASDLTKTFSQVATSFGIASLEVGVAVEESVSRVRQALHSARAQCFKRIACWKPSLVANEPPGCCSL